MDIINFSEQNSIINQYLAEIRDKDYQKNRLLFRNNVMRIGEFEAFEISKTLNYEPKDVVTPLGTAQCFRNFKSFELSDTHNSVAEE